MFSSLRVKGILSQTVHAAYPIVCFPVLVRTFFYISALINGSFLSGETTISLYKPTFSESRSSEL